MKQLLLFIGIVLLFVTEIFRVYFIMPFPGSQHANTIGLAYFIDHNRIWLRIVGVLLIAYPVLLYFRKRKPRPLIVLSALTLLYLVIFYFFNFRFEADKMFYQPSNLRFAGAAANKIPLDKLIIGVIINNEAKAYPIQLIGYHHQVRDSIGHTPVMITYCTVCRTGRVYSPLVNGRPETFRLVGMDHFNAMFEDAGTGSWWQQATGTSIAGPLKTNQLIEFPSSQSSLGQWLRQYPNTEILQPDTIYKSNYEELADYDNGTIRGGLERRDSASWKAKSWVLGVKSGNNAKAYDWNELIRHPLIQDTLGSTPIALLLDEDSACFHAWNRNVQGQTLELERIAGQSLLKDDNTGSLWNFKGQCISGPLKDQQMQTLQSYQEFWHSWSHFHPSTTQYRL